mmetsp:Transcript_35007/g.84723  ORF Transcript_35007/g.84723 Transcript_35007/m.84723 type:complete len:264 (-) Transcript_35007:8-799(-)
MAAETFFNKVSDDVLLIADQINSLVFGGGDTSSSSEDASSSSSSSTQQQQDSSSSSSSPYSGMKLDDIMDEIDVDNLSEEELQQILKEHHEETLNMMEHHSPLKGIADSVLGDIVDGQIGPQTPWEHFDAFRSAINWSEPFILAVIGFQCVMFCLCLYVSRKDRGLLPRVSALFVIGVLVRSAEWFNTVAAEHWESFATQDYFDSRGIFISIFLSGPLLLDSLMMLFMYVAEAGQLLVEVKKREMKDKQKKKKKNNKNTKKEQ